MQVRLDDDAAELVRAEQTENGGSLAAAANRLLLASRRTTTSTPPAKASKPDTTIVGAPPSRRRASASPARAPRAHSAPPVVASRTAGARAQKCSHPLLRRVGDKCAQCGNTV